MQALQEIGRLLVEGKPDQALEKLRVWARVHLPEKVSDIELQLSRINMTMQTFTKGLMTMPDYQANVLQINNGILLLLEECKAESTQGTASSLPTLHEYHAYTCDRIEHSDTFRNAFDQATEPVQFFFIYGGDMQSHEGLFRRIAYDVEGRLLDYLNPDLDNKTKALQLEMTFEFSRQLPHYKQNILRSFFSMLGLPPNEHEALLERKLDYVLERSPRTQTLKQSDYICIYLHISQYDWDPHLTPEAARWFVNEFCNCTLPIDSPRILVFFAIEYDEEDEAIKKEVKEALKTAQKLHILPELGMVEKRDLGQWLEKYKQLSPNSRARKEILNTAFGTEREFYMEDVELELKKIIDNFNNQQI